MRRTVDLQTTGERELPPEPRTAAHFDEIRKQAAKAREPSKRMAEKQKALGLLRS